MKDWKWIAATALLTLACAAPITHYACRMQVHILNGMLNTLYFEDLFILEEGGHDGCAAHNLERYIAYFREILRAVPGSADAYGMLGFCYFHAGKTEKAVAALELAIAKNPYYWGFYYNLGAVYAAQNDYGRAQEYFQKAAAAPVQAGAITVSSSKIFNDIIRQSKHTKVSIKERIEQGYALSVLAARASAYALSTGQAASGVPSLRLF